MGMVVRPRELIGAVSAPVGGQVVLDRGATAAFAVSATFVGAIANLNIRLLRWPTTGHDNLPKMHPFSPLHTYGAGTIAHPGTNYSTKVPGNVWDPTYDRATNAAPASEIMGPAAFGALWNALGGVHDVHLFFDWQNGVSEGRANPDGSGTFDWYVDPYALDINGNAILSGQLAAMRAPDFKKLENRRFLQYMIEVVGIPPEKIIINMGGEDWRGWDPPYPWPLPDDGQDRQYAYFATQARIYLADLLAFASEKGWRSKLRTCVGFLESVEGGAPIPLLPSTIARDLRHFLNQLKEVGPLLTHMGCSMHYRGTWDRYLTEDELQLSWFTPTGQGTLKEILDYFRSICRANGFPTIDLLPFANSVGDARNAEGKVAGDVEPMTQEQCGFAAWQYLAELIKAGYTMADAYGGAWGNWPSAQGSSGVCGIPDGSTAFVIWPQYYAVKMINDVLVNDAELVEFVSSETQLPTLGLRWTDPSSGESMLSLYMENKAAVARSLPVEITQVEGVRVRQSQRYSFTETTAPVVSDAASLLNKVLTVNAPAYSITRVDLVITPSNYDAWAQEVVDDIFDEFGRPAIYEEAEAGGTFADGIDVEVLPIKRDRELGGYNQTNVLAAERLVEIRAKEILAPRKGDRVTMDSTVYTVASAPERRDRFGLVWQCGLRTVPS